MGPEHSVEKQEVEKGDEKHLVHEEDRNIVDTATSTTISVFVETMYSTPKLDEIHGYTEGIVKTQNKNVKVVTNINISFSNYKKYSSQALVHLLLNR